MKTRKSLRRHLAVSLVIAALMLTHSGHAQTTLTGDHVIDGDLTVVQQIHIEGNGFDLGTTGAATSALSYIYTENGTDYTVTISLSRPAAAYLWQDDLAGTARTKMGLDQDNKLSLHDPLTPFAAQIILDPDATTPQITVGGEAVLTTSSGVAPYLPSSLAISAGTGTDSFQVGTSSSATADNATALGQSTASSYASTSIGRYNVVQGDASNWVATDDLFVVGNGADAANRSNAFVVKKNGDTQTAGTLFAEKLVIGSGGVDQNIASGLFSIAYGSYSKATGLYSLAGGDSAEASGFGSVALGSGKATEEYAASLGGGYARGNYSTAVGESAANAPYSTAMGFSVAEGNFSVAMGEETEARAYGSLVSGRFNLQGEGTEDQWIDTEDLFVLGNGNDYDNPSNALTVKKNGTLETTKLRVPPSGDLGMGDFTSGTDPRENLDPNGLHWTPPTSPSQ